MRHFRQLTRPLLMRPYQWVILLLMVGLNIGLVPLSPTAYADGESFRWKSLTEITVSGGDLAETETLTVTSGTSGGAASGTFTLHRDDDRFCDVRIAGTVSADNKTLTITDSDIGEFIGDGSGPSLSCSDDEEDAVEAWRNKSYSISGTRPTGQNETAEQRKIDVVLEYPGKASDAPASVKFTLKWNGGSKSFDSNKSVHDGQARFYGTFKDIDPGDYTVSVNKVDTKPQNVTKKKFQKLSLVFGSQRGSAIIKVETDINPTVDDPTVDQKFGPYKIELKNSKGETIQTKNVSGEYVATDSCKNWGDCGGGAFHIYPSTTFTDVEPGKYEVCFGEVCVPANKKEGEPLTVKLSFSQNDIEAAEEAGDAEGGKGAATEGCSGGALGWIVCPVIEGMQDVMLWLSEQLAILMELRPLSFANNDPVFKAWQNILSLANVMLVVAFLFIIFSQATSIGLSSYGIKSMLPKVIAAAVLMNLSYFIAAILVDASNILGNGIGELLLMATSGVGNSGYGNGVGGTIGGALESVISPLGTAIAAGTTVALVLVILFVAFVPTVITLLTVFLVLAARVSIIVLLVMLAPLAFAAWILPNTEKYFSKWLNTFIQMLVVYPAVMALFAGAVVASTVVGAAANGGVVQQIIALLILVVPLFAIPTIIKGSSSMLAKVSDLTRKNLTRGAESQITKRTAKRIGGRMANNNLVNSDNRFKRALGRSSRFVGGYTTRRDFKHKAQESAATRNQEEGLANVIMSNSRYAQKAGGDRAIAGAQAVREKRQKEETENAMAAIRSAGIFSPGDLKALTAGREVRGVHGALSGAGSEAIQRAAMQQIISSQDSQQMHAMATDGNVNQQMLYEEIQKQYSTAKGAGAHFVRLNPTPPAGQAAYTNEQMQVRAAEALSGLSYEKLAAQDGHAVQQAQAGYQQMIGKLSGQIPLEAGDDLAAIRQQASRLHEAAVAARDNPDTIKGAKQATRDAIIGIASARHPSQFGPVQPPPGNTP